MSCTWKLVLLLLVLCPKDNHGWSSADETALKDFLMTNYEDSVRPAEVTEIFLTFHMTSLDSIDIKNQLFKVSGWWKMGWDDPRLIWTPASYGNIEIVQFYEDDIWTPALVVTNSIKDLSAIDEDTIPLRIQYDRQVEWSPPGIIEASCEIDSTYFPFDKQTCSLQITSFGYALGELDINTTDGVQMDYYGESGDWEIRSTDASRAVFVDHKTPYAKLTFDITAKRRFEYYWITVMFPVIINGILIGFVFLLPTESGEKMGYSLTCLLAYVVLLTLLAADMPTSAKHTSFLEVYITLVLGMSAVSVVLSIMNCNYYFREEDRPVTKNYVTLTVWTMRIIRHHHYKSQNQAQVHPEDNQEPPSYAKHQLNGAVGNRHHALTPVRKMSVVSNKSTDSNQSSKYGGEITWKLVAEVMDAFFFRVYSVLITLFTLVFLLALSLGDL